VNIIDNLIIEFSVEQLRQFFRKKISNFKPKDENYDFLFEDKKEISDNFTDITNIGEAVLASL